MFLVIDENMRLCLYTNSGQPASQKFGLKNLQILNGYSQNTHIQKLYYSWDGIVQLKCISII